MIHQETIVIELFMNAMGIHKTDILSIVQMGGLTNHNYKVTTKNGIYAARLAGKGTDEMINRCDEHLCDLLANELGVDSELLYFDKKTGFKVSVYIDKALTMSVAQLKQPDHMFQIAQVLQKIHHCGKVVPVTFDMFEKLAVYEALLEKKGDILYPDYTAVRSQIEALRGISGTLQTQKTFCHNDPLPENFIVDGSGRMYLVDWEYSGMNDPMWDLADGIIECGYDTQEVQRFLQAYFGRPPMKSELQSILINEVYIDFLWTLWGLIRVSNGVDLQSYADERYSRSKDNLLKLKADLQVKI